MGKLKKSVRGLVVVHPRPHWAVKWARRDDRVFKDRVLSPSDDWYDRINPHLTCVSWSMRGLSCLLT